MSRTPSSMSRTVVEVEDLDIEDKVLDIEDDVLDIEDDVLDVLDVVEEEVLEVLDVDDRGRGRGRGPRRRYRCQVRRLFKKSVVIPRPSFYNLTYIVDTHLSKTWSKKLVGGATPPMLCMHGAAHEMASIGPRVQQFSNYRINHIIIHSWLSAICAFV